MEVLNDAFAQLALLGGAGALIAAVINILKTLGVVKDGQAQTWSAVANFGIFAALVGFRLFAVDVDVLGLDTQAGGFAEMLTVVFGYFVQLGGAKLFHSLLKGVPVIGKSYSG